MQQREEKDIALGEKWVISCFADPQAPTILIRVRRFPLIDSHRTSCCDLKLCRDSFFFSFIIQQRYKSVKWLASCRTILSHLFFHLLLTWAQTLLWHHAALEVPHFVDGRRCLVPLMNVHTPAQCHGQLHPTPSKGTGPRVTTKCPSVYLGSVQPLWSEVSRGQTVVLYCKKAQELLT